MIPLDRDGQIKQGTSPVNLVCHGTQSGTQDVPSNQWSTSTPEAQVLVAVILTSISGTFSIMPDYTGYGESTDFFRAYVVRRAYPTAVLPLYRHAEDLVATETNCASALADSLTTVGYSEGGYAAVAVADAMHKSGKTIISVHAGGGPFRLSSVQVNFLVQQILDGTFTSRRRYYVALLAATYSQTTTDVLNFGLGQDMLDATLRAEIVNVIHSPAGQSGINNLIPVENPLLILNQTLADTLVAALLRGEPEPCVTSAVDGESDILCEALRAQDLIDVLESTPYPVSVCHSVDDTLVSYDNLPDATANSLLTLVATEGSHQSAGVDCYLSSVLFFLDDANVQSVPVVDKTVPGGCPNPTASPAAEVDVTAIPTSRPSMLESTPDPSWTPIGTPSSIPSVAPSTLPTLSPSDSPSTRPTALLTASPSRHSSGAPSKVPVLSSSDVPSLQPSLNPTPIASLVATSVPSSIEPSTAPTSNSTSADAGVPSAAPSTVSLPLSVDGGLGSAAFPLHSQALSAMMVAVMFSLALIVQ
jgi:hypothetical protein